MANPNVSQIGKIVKLVACGATNAVAAGTGDNTAVTGASIDRLGYGSASFVIAYKTTLTAAKTLSFAAAYQESSDNSSWDTAVTLQASTVAATGAVTAEVGKVRFDLDLAGKKRYIRFNFTPDLSNTSTDVVDCAAVCVLGGAVEKPVSDPSDT
jgi:hypothetical protein